MAYTPPAGDSIDFVFSESYTAPAGDNIQFNFSGDIEVEVPEIGLTLSADLGSVSTDIFITVPSIGIAFDGDIGLIDQTVPVPVIAIQFEAVLDSVLQGQAVTIPVIEIALDGSAVCAVGVTVPGIEIALDGSVGVMDFSISVGAASLSLSAGASSVSMFSTQAALIRYYLTITGAGDGETDVEVPMSSFQARRRSGEPTYLSVVIPSTDYADQVADRSNGTIRIDQAYELDGEIAQRVPIMETDIETIDTHDGSKKSSIVITGYSTSTFSAKSVALSDATYRRQSSGKVTYRLARPYIFLAPGDTVTISDDEFVIGVMSYSISAKMSSIEITEA